ncbi:MAG: hypothetical protein IJK53_06055 [Erysipelotrichaceae bacterium]|nr:hypothetical protein [Clostridia bacterium]MBQ6216932.1 hypothetical protein [Erysipelotrichaceae bacterium]
MTTEEFKRLVKTGREIEFSYRNKRYSITYGSIDDEYVISFCEFYKESTEVKDFDDLLNVSRDGIAVKEMIESLRDKDIDVF